MKVEIPGLFTDPQSTNNICKKSSAYEGLILRIFIITTKVQNHYHLIVRQEYNTAVLCSRTLGLNIVLFNKTSNNIQIPKKKWNFINFIDKW